MRGLGIGSGISRAALSVANMAVAAGGGGSFTGTAMYLGLGQSNMDGTSGPEAFTLTEDYGDGGNTGTHPPMYMLDYASGLDESSVYSWFDHMYKPSAQPANDRILGTVTGGRAERSLKELNSAEIGATSMFYGIADKVANGFHTGANSVRSIKSAQSGQLITDQMAHFDGSRYKARRRGFQYGLRPFIAAENTAGRAVLFQSVNYSQGEAEISQAQGVVTGGLTPSTTYYRYWLHRTAGGVDGAVTTPSGGQASFTTASDETTGAFPLSLPGGTNTGTVYWFISTSATPPASAADLKAGTGAVAFGNKAVTNDGNQSLGFLYPTGLLNPDYVKWPARMRIQYDYFEEKFGFAPWWFLVQPIRTLLAPGGANEPFTSHFIDNILPTVARYSVAVNTDGSIGAITDLGADAGRRNRLVILSHSITGPGNGPDAVHFEKPGQKALGNAMVEALKVLTGSANGNLSHQMVRLAPAVITLTAGTPTNTTIPFTIKCDEIATVKALAVPQGSAAPSVATIRSTGTSFSHTVVSASGTPQAQTFTLTGLAPGTAYDVYVAVEDTVYAHYSHAARSILNISTLAGAGATWDPTFNTVTGTVYSNSNKTFGRTTTTGAEGARSSSSKSTGKYYWEVLISGITPGMVGVGDGGFPRSGSGTQGIDRCGWQAANVVFWNGASGNSQVSMGGSLAPGDVMQGCVDLTTGLMWIRRNNTGNWNNTSGADPATGVGGVTIGGFTLPAYLIGTLAASAASELTLRTSTADWSYSAPSGFDQWGV